MAISRIKAKNFDSRINEETELLFTELTKKIEKFDSARKKEKVLDSEKMLECSIKEEACDWILTLAIRDFIMDRYILIPD